MADDFNDWIDGEPITGPSSDGSFTEWIDGEPVIRYEDSATLLVIPDAAHLHEADSPGLLVDFWRLYVTANKGASTRTYIREIQMHTSYGGADVCTGGAATASEYSSTDYPANAFDDNSTTKWLTSITNMPCWIEYGFTSAVNIVEFSILAPSVSWLDYAPETFKLQHYVGGSYVDVFDIASANLSADETKTWATATNLVVAACDNLHEADNVVVTLPVTLFTTDFSDQSLGSPPSDWTERWNTADGAFDTVGGYAGTGSKAIEFDLSSSDDYGVSWDTAGTSADVEVLALIKTGYWGAVHYGGLLVRGSGSSGAENGYGLWGYSHDRLYLYKLDAGTPTQLDYEDIDNRFTTTNYTWWRFRVVGTLLKGKSWELGAAEPGTWGVEATNADITGAGWIGVDYRTTLQIPQIEWIGVDTGGGTVALPDLSTNLVVAACAHLHDADNLTITTGSAATDLVIPDAAHLHDADNLVVEFNYLIGNTTLGGTNVQYPPSPGKAVCRYQNNLGFDLVIDTYIGWQTKDFSSSTKSKAVIYSDDGEATPAPDALLGSSDEVSGMVADTWMRYGFSTTITIPNGDYFWIGLHSNSQGTSDCGSLSNGIAWNYDTYADGTTDPFGTPTWANYEYPHYVLGTPAPATTLTIPDAAHLHDADNIDLVELIDLTVAEAASLLVDEGPITIQTGLTLGVAESYHDLVDDGPLALIQEHALVVAECDNLHEADGIILTALHILTVAECYHVHAPPNLTLTEKATLTVAESFHLHDADSITVQSPAVLSIDEPFHLIFTDECYIITSWVEVLGYDYTTTFFGSYSIFTRPVATYCPIPAYGNSPHIVGVGVYFKSTHSNQIRLAVYKPAVDWYYSPSWRKSPEGADLVVDLGQTTGTDTDQWVDFSCTPTPVSVGDHTMLALKTSGTGTSMGWGSGYHTEFGGDIASYWADTDANQDETQAWADPWPDDDNPQSGNHPGWHMLVQYSTVSTLQVKPASHEHAADRIGRFNKAARPDETFHILADPGLSLTQDHTLALDESYHEHTADNLALSVPIDVAEAYHLHDADAVALTQEHNLSVDPGHHLHDAEALTLTQDHTLALADDTLLHVADTLNLAGTNVLVVAEAYHVHAADNADLIVILGVDETYHEHTAPNLTLVSGFDLEIPETVILTESDNLDLVVGLTVVECFHDHLAENLALTQLHILTVQESYHLLVSEVPNPNMTGDLAMQNAWHAIVSDEIVLTGEHTLWMNDAYHRLVDDLTAVTQEHTLVIEDDGAYHLHTADNITLPVITAGLERTFIESLTVDRAFRTRTTDLEILTLTRPINDTVLTSYLGVTTKHELASLTQVRTILRA